MFSALRFVLCIAAAALLAPPAFAAKSGGTMSLSRAQAAAERGDQQAAAAVNMTVDRETCMNECSNRGNNRRECISACRPGVCHPRGEQPYCVER